MKLLYASERPPYPFFQGGAARSAHYLMSVLSQDLGVECLAVGSGQFKNTRWSGPGPEDYGALGVSGVHHEDGGVSIRCGYRVQLLDDFPISLSALIDEYAPDVIWTQLEGMEEISRLAHAKGRNVLAYLRDAEGSPGALRAIAALGCRMVANSQFMARHLARVTGRDAPVIYPSLEKSLGVRGDPHGYLTMINPLRVKGIDTLLAIAKRLPAQRFLLVESWPLNARALSGLRRRLEALPNVLFQRRVPDVQDIYRQSKLVLVPSVWEEAFGRVVIEAQSCGIPVIASRRGGLPEAVGDGGICVADYDNAEAWISEIQRVLGDSETYEELALAAQAHAMGDRFSIQLAAQRFLELCSDPSSFRAGVSRELLPGFSAFDPQASRA